MADITDTPVVDTTADIIETHPLVDNDDLHAGVAERLRHSQEFGSALWDATKDYLQKMNLTAEERNQVGDWLHQKKDKFQSKVVEQLHKLHKVDDNQL